MGFLFLNKIITWRIDRCALVIRFRKNCFKGRLYKSREGRRRLTFVEERDRVLFEVFLSLDLFVDGGKNKEVF